MKMQEFASVWDAIEDAPDAAEHMKIRSSLMTSLKQHIKEQGWTRAEAAAALGVPQPRISDLMRGKIALFEIDALITLLHAAGLKVEVLVTRAA
ncbi:MAG: XRE family transcriptional regulator [Roseiarcus sp.]